MREILFKAKTISGNWVNGLLVNIGDKWYISNKTGSPFAYEVRPETLCQFTGLCGKNGKRIWEGDIISYQRDNDDCPFPNKDTKKRFGKVFYQGFRSTFAIGMGRNGSRSINDDLWKYVQNGNRVDAIGNRFDNPELLQEESDE
jgi:uncharacterized phage protein (TIGR01671 family)